MESCDEVKDTMTLEELEKNILDLIPDLKEASVKPVVHNPFISHLKVKPIDILQVSETISC